MKLLAHRRTYVLCLVASAAALCSASSTFAAISYSGEAYSQNFDSLSGSGPIAWTNDSTLAGWELYRKPAPGTPITSITGASGGSNAGAFYSFGLGDGDQALGGVGSGGTYWGSPSTGSVAGWMAVGLTNDTGSSIDAFTVSFDGEQWRDGGNTNTQNMVLEYGFGSSFDSISAWTAPGGNFDFVSPSTAGPAGARDGNDPTNRVAGLGGEVPGINWTAGDTLWLRWIEDNNTGNDHGLAIDNLVLSTETIVEPPVDNADFDGDGDIDGRDFLTWQRGYGIGISLQEGDANGDNTVDGLDLGIWQTQYATTPELAAVSAVPEPSAIFILLGGLFGLTGVRARS